MKNICQILLGWILKKNSMNKLGESWMLENIEMGNKWEGRVHSNEHRVGALFRYRITAESKGSFLPLFSHAFIMNLQRLLTVLDYFSIRDSSSAWLEGFVWLLFLSLFIDEQK